MVPQIGVNGADILGKQNFFETATKRIVGGQAGLAYERKLKGPWRLAVGLSYQQKGYAYKVPVVHSRTNGVPASGSNRVRYQYVQMDVRARLLTGLGLSEEDGFYFEFGGYGGLGTSAQHDWSLIFGERNLVRQSGKAQLAFVQKIDYRPDTTLVRARPWDGGIVLASGYELRNLRFTVGYMLGLANIQPKAVGKTQGDKIVKRNEVLFIRFGFPFAIERLTGKKRSPVEIY